MSGWWIVAGGVVFWVGLLAACREWLWEADHLLPDYDNIDFVDIDPRER